MGWKYSEIEKILNKEEAEEFAHAYDINEKGNFTEGKSLPRINYKIEERKSYLAHKNKILAFRNKRIEPTRDKKKIAVWNALLIRGLVDASRAFYRKDWLQMAIDLNEWMSQSLLSNENEVSSISFENNQLSQLSFLDDYAIWAESLLCLSSLSDWVKPGSSSSYIKQAEILTLSAIEKFKDKQSCGFYFSEKQNDNPAQVRKKFWYDNATPSANSSLLRVFSTLYQLTDKKAWLTEFKEARAGYPNLCRQAPQGIGQALSSIAEEAIGLATLTCPATQIDEIVLKISQKPYRPIFISSLEENLKTKGVLKIGKTFEDKVKETDPLIEKLFS